MDESNYLMQEYIAGGKLIARDIHAHTPCSSATKLLYQLLLQPQLWSYSKLSFCYQLLTTLQSYCVEGTVRQMILKQMSHPMRRVYSDNDCLRWSSDVARALVYLHSGAAGSMILHRDINPDNIMLTSQDPHRSGAKLVDFGLHTSIAHSENCSADGEHSCSP